MAIGSSTTYRVTDEGRGTSIRIVRVGALKGHLARIVPDGCAAADLMKSGLADHGVTVASQVVVMADGDSCRQRHRDFGHRIERVR